MGIYNDVIGMIFNVMLIAGIISCLYGTLTSRSAYNYHTGDNRTKESLKWIHKNEFMMQLLIFVLMIWLPIIKMEYGIVWIFPIVAILDRNKVIFKKFWLYFVCNLTENIIWIGCFAHALVYLGFLKQLIIK